MRLEVEQIIGYDYLTSERFLEFQYSFRTSSPNTQGARNSILIYTKSLAVSYERLANFQHREYRVPVRLKHGNEFLAKC